GDQAEIRRGGQPWGWACEGGAWRGDQCADRADAGAAGKAGWAGGGCPRAGGDPARRGEGECGGGGDAGAGEEGDADGVWEAGAELLRPPTERRSKREHGAFVDALAICSDQNLRLQ